MALTPEYQAYLRSDEWKAKRRKVLHRAGYKCQACKKRQAWQVHHLTYERRFNERLSDLQAICGRCHQEIHGIKRKPKKRVFKGLKRVFAKVIG